MTDNGTIHVTGNSAINSASVSNGQLTVDATTTLTLDNTTVTGTTITDNGTLKVNIGKTLSLSGVTLTGGSHRPTYGTMSPSPANSFDRSTTSWPTTS